MRMTRSVRKLALAIHITLAVGWIGGVADYLVLVVAAMSSPSAQTLRRLVSMDLIGWYLLGASVAFAPGLGLSPSWRCSLCRIDPVSIRLSGTFAESNLCSL